MGLDLMWPMLMAKKKKKMFTAMGMYVWKWVLDIPSSGSDFEWEAVFKHLRNENRFSVKRKRFYM